MQGELQAKGEKSKGVVSALGTKLRL